MLSFVPRRPVSTSPQRPHATSGRTAFSVLARIVSGRGMTFFSMQRPQNGLGYVAAMSSPVMVPQSPSFMAQHAGSVMPAAAAMEEREIAALNRRAEDMEYAFAEAERRIETAQVIAHRTPELAAQLSEETHSTLAGLDDLQEKWDRHASEVSRRSDPIRPNLSATPSLKPAQRGQQPTGLREARLPSSTRIDPHKVMKALINRDSGPPRNLRRGQTAAQKSTLQQRVDALAATLHSERAKLEEHIQPRLDPRRRLRNDLAPVLKPKSKARQEEDA